MNAANSKIERPQRWTEPLDPAMSPAKVDQILQIAPFAQMIESQFSPSLPLRGILKNDCRVLNLRKGDIVVREGDYGNSAFLIIQGEALVSLKTLPAGVLGRVESKRKSLFQTLAQIWPTPHAEVRRYDQSPNRDDPVGRREDPQGTRVFLHDIPRVIAPEESVSMYAGEIFGEISALTRTPRSATVVANEDSTILEIRWQGLRDLMKNDVALRKHVESLYRENSLRSHLREIEIFSELSADQLGKIAERTEFETFGKFQWNIDYRSTRKKDVAERILDEPVIVNQGEYVNSLFLVRNGFVRVCRQHGDGIQTVAYMGKGGMLGLREIASNWRSNEQRAWALSLRAVGYVDILRIPVEAIEQFLLPHVDPDLIPELKTNDNTESGKASTDRRRGQRRNEMKRGLLEFLVEERLTNGTKAMMIDLDRCTRCDDCVRACAATHDNNPRFVRQGYVHENWMFTNACMHCTDPVCMIGCPTGAIGRDFKSGNVTINDETCIGCSTCANSCPYNNIQMVAINDRQGRPIVDRESNEPIIKATKCDLCVEQWGGPACQRACPHDALIRIDLSEPTEVTEWTRGN